jgi:signal transduction histidine kinase
MIRRMATSRRIDAGIAALASLVGAAIMYANVRDDTIAADPLTIPLILLVTVPLVWRSSAPVAALGAALAGLVVHDLLFGAAVVRCGIVLPTVFLLVFSAAAGRERREALAGLALGLGAVVAESITFFGAIGIVFAVITGAIWGIGRVVRSRARLADELRARTAELRRTRDERARMEVAADRARLSGELDRLLQRRLGELAQLADAGSQPGDAAATLARIERESRETLDEMRAAVGVLRDAPETEPLPALAHLEALLVAADARLAVEGSPRALPPAVELSAYRIVEQLLDALAGAPGVDVRVRFTDTTLEVAVSGPARRRAGAAIESARERARLQRGSLEATVRGGRAEAFVSLPTASAA